jgi:hypothetical protein
MRYPQTFTTWKITCRSEGDSQALQQWLTSRTDLNRLITDSLSTQPNGVQQTEVINHRLGDYFEEIRVLPGNSHNANSFRLVFHRRTDAGRFWKDLMVNSLQEIEAAPQKPRIEFDSKGDTEPQANSALS